MRDRLLVVPFVKQQYDAKVTADATFATDQTKQQEFFRAVGREVSPFLQPQSKEPLAALVKALQGGGPAPAAENPASATPPAPAAPAAPAPAAAPAAPAPAAPAAP